MREAIGAIAIVKPEAKRAHAKRRARLRVCDGVQAHDIDEGQIVQREITPFDIEAAVKKAGVPIPKRGTVLLCTGHHERTFPTPAYATDNPGVNVAATEWLAAQGIVHFGIDSMRPGPEGKVNSLVHKACLDLDITHIESLCNLESLLGEGEFQFIGLPLKWREGTGSPIRAVAVFND